MKKFFLALFSFLLVIASVCGASRMVFAVAASGTVPSQKPLQPPPAGVSPNLQGNINFQGQAQQGSVPVQSSNVEENSGPAVGANEANPGSEAAAVQQGPTTGAGVFTPSSKLLWFALGVMILAVFGYVLMKRYGEKK